MPSAAFRFWTAVHRYGGLATLLLLLFAALTGSVLVFTRDLDAALNADLFNQPAVVAPPPVAPLVDRFAAAHPGLTVRSFPLAVPADRRIPVKVVGPRGASPRIDQVFLDRATGDLAGSRLSIAAFNRRGIMAWLHDAHYTLLADRPGRWLMGGVAAVWLVGNLVGVYLTLPRRSPFWRQWKRMWRIGFKSSFSRLMVDLHRAPGLWLLAPFTALALTGVCINFLSDAYEPVLDRLAPEPVTTLARPAGWTPHPLTFTTTLEAARVQAIRRGTTWQPATMVNSAKDGRIGVTLTDDGRLNYHWLGPVYLYFDRRQGYLADIADPYGGNTHLALIRWLYPVHSGRVFGLTSIVLVFLSGLFTVAMGGTGTYIWWKKRGPRLAARGQGKSSV